MRLKNWRAAAIFAAGIITLGMSACNGQTAEEREHPAAETTALEQETGSEETGSEAIGSGETGGGETEAGETLDGEAVDSSIFGDYDLTLFYVWGTYIYPDVDNLADVQQAYEHAKELGNVNVVALCIDTPTSELDNSDEAKEIAETAKKAFEDAGAEFTVLRLDGELASFIQNNFETIPAFTMVDRNGIARGGYYEGIYSGDDYSRFIDAALNEYVYPDETAQTEAE